MGKCKIWKMIPGLNDGLRTIDNFKQELNSTEWKEEITKTEYFQQHLDTAHSQRMYGQLTFCCTTLKELTGGGEDNNYYHQVYSKVKKDYAIGQIWFGPLLSIQCQDQLSNGNLYIVADVREVIHLEDTLFYIHTEDKKRFLCSKNVSGFSRFQDDDMFVFPLRKHTSQPFTVLY